MPAINRPKSIDAAIKRKPKLFVSGSVLRAQAMVEFALIAPLVLIGLLVGVQFAVLGAGDLALGQAAYQAARYASINGSASEAAVKSAVDTVASPLIKNKYSLSMTPTTSRATGATVQVTVTWNASSLIFLPNPFFYGLSFPSAFSATQSAYTE